MIAQFVREIVKDISEARQARQDRHVVAWLLPFDEALAFFNRNGVALNGVTSQEQLNEALLGHYKALQDPHTIGNPVFEMQIAAYLGAHGCPRF